MKSKFFRVVIEGDTVDGRTINRQEVADMAATYNRATYGARVNLEHMRGMLVDGPFQSLGDVLSVKSQEDELEIGGKKQKRLALYAEIAPLPALIEINTKRQKIYTSVEIAPNFANTGKAGLVGLAITDSPASLGTEILQFAAQNPAASPFKDRKQHADNLFSAGRETVIEFFDDAASNTDETTGAMAAVKKFFEGLTAKQETTVVTPPVVTSQPDANAAMFTQGLEALAKVVDDGLKRLSDAQTAQAASQTAALTALEAKLEVEPAKKHNARPSQKGPASDTIQTDC